MHFKDEGVPKVQVAFQSGEVKVLEESQLMSEKAPRCDVQITSRVFFVSGAWDLYLAIYILLFIDAHCIFGCRVGNLFCLAINRCTSYLYGRTESF